MKPFIFTIIVFCFLSCINSNRGNSSAPEQQGEPSPNPVLLERAKLYTSVKTKADTLRNFCTKGKYNTNYGILVDMSIHSGKKRMFVWDFAKDTIVWSGLCCHGYGKGSTGGKIVFSNEPGSYCSSLGKYKIGQRSYSKWGIHVHYKLHGLDSTNSNAYERQVVLHSYSEVDDVEIYPAHLILGFSQGCPVIADDLMTKIDSLLKKVNKPLILWIYQ